MSTGIVFKREYDLIIRDLMDAVQKIEDFYKFIEMNREDWEALGKEEKIDCIRAMSNDVFYGLGGQPVLPVGSGMAVYDRKKGYIKVFDGEKCTQVIQLN